MRQNERGSIISKLLYIICVLILIYIAFKLYHHYEQSNFNDFIRTEYIPYTSKFIRDFEVKYSNINSYKIISEKENDAMFYKTISVTPNTPYKVTCMVRTQDIKTIKEVSSGGAHICISDTVEKSESVKGTNDWQKLEFIFNSKNRTSVNIGFRLGGYDDNCTGTAWFSDFMIESGSSNEDSNWNFACLVFENTNVTIDQNGEKKQINLSMSTTDIADMRQNMARFKTSCEELSNHKMSVNYDFIQVKEAITSLSYDNQNGYYVGPENIENILKSYRQGKNYDHIFICVRLGDRMHQNDIPVYDWIGLGGMDYLGIGFSNIRLPNSEKSYTYKYDARINTFPEEVFLHEFLHSLERTAKEYGFERPELHDYAKYGYQEERFIGLKKWYQDYMNKNIKTQNGMIGLDEAIYRLKPNHEDDFTYSYQMDEFKEPTNIIEKINQIFQKAVENVGNVTMKKEGNNI